jgi:hypothetical protein
MAPLTMRLAPMVAVTHNTAKSNAAFANANGGFGIEMEGEDIPSPLRCAALGALNF